MQIHLHHCFFDKLKTVILTSSISTALTMTIPSVQARSISAQEALQRVMDQTQAKTLNFQVTPHLVYTLPINSTETPGLYVFNHADSRGFMVLSADDEAQALLGYSETGSFDPENIPAPMVYWLDCYTQEIASIPEAVSPQNRVMRKTRENKRGPLLTTKWGQDTPYNNKCPKYNGSRTLTGCTATAMAQVMKYFNYPDKGSGSNTYQWKGQEISSNFEEHTYDWRNMLNSYSGNYSTKQSDAVSQLMRDCAIAVNTNFGIKGSYAYSIYSVAALMAYFGYDKQARLMEREFYTLWEWQEAIYNQLDNHGPLIYMGSTPDNEGHAFVCDGYENDYFHMNWGWNGICDGYFLLSALDPQQQGSGGTNSGYNLGHCIVTEIYPDEGGAYWLEITSPFAFEIKQASAKLGESIDFSVGIKNDSPFSFFPGIGLAFTSISEDRTIFTSGQPLDIEIGPCQYFLEPLNFTENIPGGLSDGIYIVRPAYDDLEGEWHILHVATSENRSYKAIVKGNKITFTEDVEPTPTITESDILTTLYPSCRFKASMTLKNPSNEVFSGNIYACFIKGNSVVHQAKEFSGYLLGQAEEQLEYYGTCRLSSGTYQFGYCIDSPYDSGYYLLISDLETVTVEQANMVLPEISEFRFPDDNTTNIDASRLTFTFDATLNGGIYQDILYVALFPASGGEALVVMNTDIISFHEGLNPDITIISNVSEWLEIGKTYQMALYHWDGDDWVLLSDIYNITIGSLNGINDITADQEIISTIYYNLQGVQLKDTPTDGGVYIKVDSMRNGTVHTSKIMVR